VAIDPRDLDAQGNLGVLLYFKGDYARAEPHLRAAFELQPDLSKIRALLGMREKHLSKMELAQGDREAAVPNLKETNVIENLTGGPMILEAKSSRTHRWISCELEGSPSNRLALNARVFVTTDKLRQMSEVRSGGRYLSQNDLRLHFGLGDATRIEKVEILWPNGGSQVFRDVVPDHFYHLKQDGALTLRR
jgi:hypothetical protein